jgi:hypothetical protein
MNKIERAIKRIYHLLAGPSIYYFLAGPVYRRVKHETALETQQLHQHHLELHDRLSQQLTAAIQEIQRVDRHHLELHERLSQQVTVTVQEIQRISHHHLELQGQLSQHVADEFIKMYKMIDDIKCDRADYKLNVTIVDELIKIHKSIEGLKYEQNGRE